MNIFTKVSNVDIPYEFSEPREGDFPAFWADADKAKSELNWIAEKTIEDMMRDTWRWQSQNPNGYKD